MTTDEQPTDAAPDYERMAAELMQQWQQQFTNPAAMETLQQGLQQGATVAQEMLQMGQALWQGWVASAQPAGQTNGPAGNQPSPQPAQSGYAAAHVSESAAATAAAVSPAGARNSDAAAAPVDPGASSPTNPMGASSLASVALCAELARRLDLLANRVLQLEQQLQNK